MDPIKQLQQRLQHVDKVAMYSCALEQSRTGWNAMGVGTVQISAQQQGNISGLTLTEVGRLYLPAAARQVAFKNQLQLLFHTTHIAFYRQRVAQQFEWLFDLTFIEQQGYFFSQKSYHCGSDHYSLRLIPSDNELILRWRITGAAKNEHIDYIYY